MITDRQLALLARKMLKALKEGRADVDIILMDNRHMAELKARFFKKKSEPNVISFPEPQSFPHPESKKRYLGEIYLNKDILRRSPERAKPLLLHGILHLLGYDHTRKPDIEEMEGLEKKILAKL